MTDAFDTPDRNAALHAPHLSDDAALTTELRALRTAYRCALGPGRRMLFPPSWRSKSIERWQPVLDALSAASTTT